MVVNVFAGIGVTFVVLVTIGILWHLWEHWCKMWKAPWEIYSLRRQLGEIRKQLEKKRRRKK